jgi:transaldolase
MKLFLDTANVEQITEGVKLGLISGVTTNPTLVAKEGEYDYKEVVKEICNIIDGPVSVEVVVEKAVEMLNQAREISTWASNVVVKIPATEEGYKIMSQLCNEGIKVNMTLCFSLNQALLGAVAGVTYVSPFVGRLDDVGHDGMELVKDIVEAFYLYGFETEVIAASIRHPLHCVTAVKAGADIATIPYHVFKQMMKHPMTETGVVKFINDWENIQPKKGKNPK